MIEPTQHAKDYADATHYQRMAADPRSTRLASANAGSGKTRVLVARVSRLLLDGADPGKILCLTYTKAAASEMQTRLFETLGKWSVMDTETLNAELDVLLGEQKNRDTEELGKARRLFARALETPEGLKVQTIHAFCERVLSRFPIEAGILPGFEPMDEVDVLTLRTQTEEAIYKAAWSDTKGKLARALNILASARADQTLDGLFRWMAGNGHKIKGWTKAEGTAPLVAQLGLPEDATALSQYQAAWHDLTKAPIKTAANSLLGSSNKNDVAKAETILNALTTENTVEAFDTYTDIILTQKGDIRSGVVTKSAPQPAQDFFGIRGEDPPLEALRVHTAVQNILAAKCLEMTQAVYTLAIDYAKRYSTGKLARRWLDFNDQIEKVRDLLVRNDVADWVRYKLDGGIGHILVDEAQDTAPDQWDIIDALIDGFELPDPDWPKGKEKTFFAVGDEKQSIYSFQGARPELFLKKIREHTLGGEDDTIKMRMSFRSASEVLEVVDNILIDQGGMTRMFDLDPGSAGPFQVRHSAHRQDHGQVDLWPLSPPPEDVPEELPWDTTPVDAPSQASSRERLAREIATQVKTWLDNKEPVFDRELKTSRPLCAGDILILVRNRGGGFFDAIIRNLKQTGVAVAGADRLVLKDAVVVKDFLSLTRFVLLPQDDLSLAEVLKSPLFGFTDDALFDVAHGREKKPLWSALRESEDKVATETVRLLSNIITYSRRYAPYEFYTRVLDIISAGGLSMRERIHARLGVEAKDVLEAFLARALAHQRRGAPSLQHFLQAFSQDAQDIKREMDSGSGEVRVMTVHGAKGLEAPVVILPDTTQMPSSRGGSGLFPFEGGYAYLPSKGETPATISPARDAIEARAKEEYMRLLYVAMTRAESRLVVCGYHSGHKKGSGLAEGCWYEEVSKAMESLDTQGITSPLGDGLSYGIGASPITDVKKSNDRKSSKLPDWITEMASPERPLPTHVTPSHLLASSNTDMPVRSPLVESVNRFQRGNLIHKLLEILPDIAVAKRQATAKAFLESHKNLSDAQRSVISDEVFNVLDAPEFAAIFAPGSRAEVSLAGRAKSLPQGLYLNAQIDRLAVTGSQVFIVDYKSNRPPPKTQDAVAQIYWGQMAAYRELARAIYPNHDVKCALLWTDAPRLMILDDTRLDTALTQIVSVPTYGATENP